MDILELWRTIITLIVSLTPKCCGGKHCCALVSFSCWVCFFFRRPQTTKMTTDAYIIIFVNMSCFCGCKATATGHPHYCSYIFFFVVKSCFTSTETIRISRDLRPGRPPRLSHSSWALMLLSVQCCFTSTETVRTSRDKDHRTATSVVPSMLLDVHRDRKETGETVRRQGSPGRPCPDHSSWNLGDCSSFNAAWVHRDHKDC